MKSQIIRCTLLREKRFGDSPATYCEQGASDNAGNKRVNIPPTLEDMWFDHKTRLVCFKYRDKDGSSKIWRTDPSRCDGFEYSSKGFSDPEKK